MTVHCNHVDKPADVDDDDNNNVALLLLLSSLLFNINIKYHLVSTCQVRTFHSDTCECSYIL